MGFFLTQQHKGLLENIFKISFTSILYSIIRKIHQKAFKFHATSNCRLRTNMFENITIQQSIVITKSTGIFENALNLKYFLRTFSFLRTLFSLVLSKRWQEDVPRIVRFFVCGFLTDENKHLKSHFTRAPNAPKCLQFLF